MTAPVWFLEAIRTGRLMGWETRRHGTTLPAGSALTNAVSAQLLRAALVLPDRAAGRRGRLGRRVDGVVAAFFAAALARARLVAVPPARVRSPRRSLLPWWSGGLAAGVVGLLHAGLVAAHDLSVAWVAVVAGAVLVAVIGPAVLGGRVVALRDHRPDDALTGTWLAPWWAAALLAVACVVSGAVASASAPDGWALPAGLLFGMLPAGTALVEAGAYHPEDRADRAADGDRRRVTRQARRRQRQWARALARWSRAHARLVAGVDAVTGPAEAARHRARLIVARHAARYGWYVAGAPAAMLPGPLDPPAAAVPADELRTPLRIAERLVPSVALAEQAARWLDRGSVTPVADTPANRSTTT